MRIGPTLRWRSRVSPGAIKPGKFHGLGPGPLLLRRPTRGDRHASRVAGRPGQLSRASARCVDVEEEAEQLDLPEHGRSVSQSPFERTSRS